MVFVKNYAKKLINALLNIFDSNLLVAVKNGFIMMIPVMLVGSAAIMINNFPWPSFQIFMTSVFGDHWKNFGGFVYSGTFQIMSVALLLSISYSITTSSNPYKDNKINAIVPPFVAFGCLLIITNTSADSAIPLNWLGALGLFLSIFVSIFSTYVFIWFCEHRLVSLKSLAKEIDGVMSKSFYCIEPALMTFIAFAILRTVSVNLGINNMNESIYELMKGINLGNLNSLSTAISFNLFSHIFWFFGLHGNNILEPITQSLFVPALQQNIDLYAQGLAPVNIITKQFFDIFVYLGGSGSGLCLIFALFVGGRKNGGVKWGKLSLPFALFNINELLIFGLPIVLNPMYFIPFLLTPCVLTVSAYFAMKTGLVPLTVQNTEWTTPIIFGGYYATQSIRGVLLQIFNLFLGMLIYLPFVKIADKQKQNKHKETLSKLFDIVHSGQSEHSDSIISRRDAIGFLTRYLVSELRTYIQEDRLCLHYQPQVNCRGEIVGAEALLRWSHDKFGMIPPMVTVTIAQEARIGYELGNWVIGEGIRQMKTWTQMQERGEIALPDDFVLSINISPTELKDPKLVDFIKKCLVDNGVNPKSIEFEITESVALGMSTQVSDTLEAIKKTGVSLAIDDFGMGHSSLQYLKMFRVDTVKIDGSLTNDLSDGSSNVDIIVAIVNLCHSLDINVIAEVVETKENAEKLFQLQCDWIQGYYFSRPLTTKDFLHYAISNKFNKQI